MNSCAFYFGEVNYEEICWGWGVTKASDQERKSGHEIYHTMNREKFYFLIKTILIC